VRRRRPLQKGAVRRVEDIIDRLRGRGGDQDASKNEGKKKYDWRKHVGARTLDINRNRELFTDLVTRDYDFLLSQRFAASQRTLADLLPQSVLGRAQNGHGLFTDEFGTALRFPDATFDRILTVLEGIDPNFKGHLVRARRGQLLKGLGDWLLARLDQPTLVLDLEDGPPLGIDFLAGREVDTRAFLSGMVLAGYMDDWRTREATMLEHRKTFGGDPFLIGGGEILIVDSEKFEMCGLGDTGSVHFDDHQLRTLKDIGVICNNQEASYSFPDYDQAYFRRRLGDGICDDLAMILVGARYGLDAMLGAFVMDGIDTYDKFLLNLTGGGYDGYLAHRIQVHFLDTEGQQLVDDRAILGLIHTAAKANEPTVKVSSSHRRLIQYERHSTVPTVLNHWRFLQGELVYEIKLGFARVPAHEFYVAAHARLKAAGVEVPEPRFTKADKRDVNR
jgi:hypothetical protein